MIAILVFPSFIYYVCMYVRMFNILSTRVIVTVAPNRGPYRVHSLVKQLILTMVESFSVPSDFTEGLVVTRREPIQDLIRSMSNLYLDPEATAESGEDKVEQQEAYEGHQTTTGAGEDQLPPPPEKPEQSQFSMELATCLPHQCSYAGTGGSIRAANRTAGGTSMRTR